MVGFAAVPACARLRPATGNALQDDRAGQPRRRRLPAPGVGPADERNAGFTLIEVVVALALFALIAAAGAALVTTVLDAQRHTAGRVDRLADIERTMAVVTRDFDEIIDAPLIGSSGGLAFDRHAGSGAAGVSYRLAGNRFERVRGGRAALLLGDVVAIRWQYLAPGGGWQDHWPADEYQARVWPAAIAVDLDLGGAPPNGRLRRFVDLPVRPLPPGAVAVP